MLRRMPHAAGADYKDVTGPTDLAPGFPSTGSLRDGPVEQALVVDTADGLVVLTGWAHPGIIRILEAVHAQRPGRSIALVMGGFHLRSASKSKVTRIIRIFRRLGVKKVAPTHCTGDAARRQFQKAYAKDYIVGGAGKIVALGFQHN